MSHELQLPYSTSTNCCRTRCFTGLRSSAKRHEASAIRSATRILKCLWRVLTDMRNRVSHGYFDVDLDVVWNTVTRDLPKLQESVTRILAELDSEAEDSR